MVSEWTDPNVSQADPLTDEELDNIDIDPTIEPDPDQISVSGTVWVKDGFSGGYGTSVSMDVKNPETGEWVQARHTKFESNDLRTSVGAAGGWGFVAGINQSALSFLPDSGPVTVDIRVTLHGVDGVCLPLSEKAEAESTTQDYTKDGCTYIIRNVNTGERAEAESGRNVKIDWLLGNEPTVSVNLDMDTPVAAPTNPTPGELVNVEAEVTNRGSDAVVGWPYTIKIGAEIVEPDGTITVNPGETTKIDQNVRIPSTMDPQEYQLCVEIQRPDRL